MHYIRSLPMVVARNGIVVAIMSLEISSILRLVGALVEILWHRVQYVVVVVVISNNN